jgi:mannonate dehydratase
VAEEVGVKLALHPDDPPISQYAGVPRIFHNLDALQRAIDTVPSPNHGLGFCQGTVATMAGVDAVEAIYRFGRQNKIFFVHFRNPRGQTPVFAEVFPDEGDTDMFAAVRAYRDVGVDGVARIDHCPPMLGDNDRHERSFAFQGGYAKGLVEALQAFEPAFPPKGGR